MSTELFDPLYHPYASIRYPVFATRGMVNCSVPQASAAGLEILRRGGNAMDAAVAAAAALTVTEPISNGLGSDAFALIWSEKDRKLFGLNSSGPAPMLLSPENLEKDGRIEDGRMCKRGWTPVTVPGAVKAWSEISSRFGRLPFEELLMPAADYAENGWAIGANQAQGWQDAIRDHRENLKGGEFDALFETFTKDGKAPEAGDIITLPDHARTLRAIAASHTEDFYHGEIARRIDAESRKYGGYLRFEDLDRFEAQWVEPARVNYRGYEVCEIPPNGQGINALMALNILDQFELTQKESARTYHLQMEAMKIAFADGLHYIADPRGRDSLADFYRFALTPGYGKLRAREIGDRAGLYTHLTTPAGGTVYLCCVDGEGNMVSYIQSNYMGFGSGIVVKGTGIALQNRGYDFSLDPAAENYLVPGRRTYHTIIPGFLMKSGEPVGPFGVMGAYMQPQGHVQVVMNLVDFHLDPQQAIDAPRWQWTGGKTFLLESAFDSGIAAKLRRMGHDVTMSLDTGSFGKGQMIVRLGNGVLCGGTESRFDSNIACW